MQISTTEIRNGSHTGKLVWICHYNQPDLNKRPLRKVPPTEVLIRHISELPKGKKVYYSESFFSPLTKDGTPKKTIISPVDNTGYRMHPGTELFVFDNKEECVECWNTQVEKSIDEVNTIIKNVKQTWEDKRDELKSLKC